MLTRKKGMKGKVLPIMLALLLVFNFSSMSFAETNEDNGLNVEAINAENGETATPDTLTVEEIVGVEIPGNTNGYKEDCDFYIRYPSASDLNNVETKISESDLENIGLSFDIIDDKELQWSIDEDSDFYVKKVAVKGGPNYLEYVYEGTGLYEDSGLFAPLVGIKGNRSDISNFAFCFGEKEVPEVPAKGTLEICKVIIPEAIVNGENAVAAAVSNEIPAGPVFRVEVYEDLGDSKGDLVHTFILNESNEYCDSKELLVGDYLIKEVNIPNGFEFEGFYENEKGAGYEALPVINEVYLAVEIVENETESIIVKNKEVEEVLEGTLEVKKEVLGLGDVATPTFEIIVRDAATEELDIVHTFNLGNGATGTVDTGTVDLEVGTYYLRERDIPSGYALEGYYENDGETPITPRIGDPAIYIELEITEDGTTRILVRNNVVETPGNGDNGNGTDPGNGTPPPTGGGGPINTVIVQDLDEEPVAIEVPAPDAPAEEIIVPVPAPDAPEPVTFEEPAPALPDTGANNTAIRTFGLLVLTAGITLHLLDRRRIKE